MTYIEPPVEVDAVALSEEAFAYIQAAIPGWLPAPGNLDTLLIESVSQAAADQAEVASGMMTSAFRYLGPLFGVPALSATPAVATAVITVADAAGYTITASLTTVGLRDADGTLQAFDMFADLVIPPGQTTGTALFDAEVAGLDGNGLSGSAELISVPSAVTSVLFTTATAGGNDAETDDTYLDRLALTLQTISPRPVVTTDWSTIARETPGVYRATTVDNLKPGPPYDTAAEATNVPLTTTVAVTDVNGLDPGSTARSAAQASLTAMRGQNYQVYVVAPQYSSIDVSATVRPWPTYDPTDVTARVTAALTSALNPAIWGVDQSGDPTSWANDPIMRQSELLAIVSNVEGVRYCSALTFCLHGGTLATTDVTMGPGSAIPALPTAGTITVTGLTP